MSTSIIENFIRTEILNRGLPVQPVDNFRTHIQLLLDAAKRRGWETLAMGNSVTGFYDESGAPVGTLQHMLTSATSSSAVNICSRKHVAKAHFRQSAVPIAEGRCFPMEDQESARNYF